MDLRRVGDADAGRIILSTGEIASDPYRLPEMTNPRSCKSRACAHRRIVSVTGGRRGPEAAVPTAPCGSRN